MAVYDDKTANDPDKLGKHDLFRKLSKDEERKIK